MQFRNTSVWPLIASAVVATLSNLNRRNVAVKNPDAIALLKADHAAVKELFEQFSVLAEAKAPALRKKEMIAQKICKELTVHAQIEEEIFYPAIRAAIDDHLLLDEADVEHASCKLLIEQIESMNPADDQYDAKVVVLGEYIEHHVKEEHGEMFPKARKADLDLDALGAAISERKKQLLANYEPHSIAMA